MPEDLIIYPAQYFHMKNIKRGKLYSVPASKTEISLGNPRKKFALLSSRSDSGRKRSDCNGVAQENTDYLTEEVMQLQTLSY